MRKIIEYLRNLTKASSDDSSKRFIALYVVLILITYLVIRYTNKHNVELILAELLGFAGALLAVGTWGNVQATKNSQIKENENGQIF